MPRFGVSIIPSATGRSDPVALARRAEELGFDLVSNWDRWGRAYVPGTV